MHNKKNRETLLSACDGALVVLTAYDELQQTADVAAPFMQEANFWWLTGISEPGWKVIIEPPHGKTTLVCPSISEIERIFNGNLDVAETQKACVADSVITMPEFEPTLRRLARKHSVVYSYQDKHDYEFVLNPAPNDLNGLLNRTFKSVQSCSSQLASLRAIKQPHEVTAIKKAVQLTCSAFKEVCDILPTLATENQVEAEFVYRFHRANVVHAYEPIVASGINACTLHHPAGSAELSDMHGVLIDIGANINGYCADITRTYFLNPTPRQQQVHTAVQDAHNKIIALLKPDLLVIDYISLVDDIMKDALQALGLLPDRNDNKLYRTYFPHAISHGLGINTHDPLGMPRYFKPGMVLTVEPGIYVREESIGVRIEDDILITKTGNQNLSGALPIGW